MNRSGSNPLHLAVQNTGKSNSGPELVKEEQHRIILLLLGRGASGTDIDAKGRMVLLYGFIKKTQNTSPADLELARKNKALHESELKREK